MFRQYLRQNFDEEVAIGAEKAEHPTVGKRLHIDLRDLCGIGGDASPVAVCIVDFALKGGWVNRQNPYAQFLVFRDFGLDARDRNMRTSALENRAIVIWIEGVDEVHFANRDAVFRRTHSGRGAHSRKCIADPRGVLQPAWHFHRIKRFGLEWLRKYRFPDETDGWTLRENRLRENGDGDESK